MENSNTSYIYFCIILCYDCYTKVKVGDYMDYEKKLNDLIRNNNGMVVTKDVTVSGIPREYLSILVKKGVLERVAHGVYFTAEVSVDEMYCIQLRSDKLVFSNETALYLHDLTDRDPLFYTVTVPRGYSTNRLRENGIVTYTVKPEIYNVGVTTTKTIYGREIKVYDTERTICDIIKNRNKMDKDMFFMALKSYSSSKRRNINRLLSYARLMNIEKLVVQYMEGYLV